MSIFEDAVAVVREAERFVLGTKIHNVWRPLESTVDAVVHVVMFIVVGFQRRFQGFIFGLVLIPVWRGILWMLASIINRISGAPHSPEPGWIVAAVLAAGSIIFALPSRTACAGVLPSHIEKLAAHIQLKAPDEGRLKSLQSGVAVIDAVGAQRITRMNWFLGLCWAGLIWVTSHWVLATEVPNPMRQEAANYVCVGLLIFLFIGLTVACYETAARMVKQTIDFAFLQASDKPLLDEAAWLALGKESDVPLKSVID